MSDPVSQRRIARLEEDLRSLIEMLSFTYTQRVGRVEEQLDEVSADLALIKAMLTKLMPVGRATLPVLSNDDFRDECDR